MFTVHTYRVCLVVEAVTLLLRKRVFPWTLSSQNHCHSCSEGRLTLEVDDQQNSDYVNLKSTLELSTCQIFT